MDRSEMLSIIEKAARHGWMHSRWDWRSVKVDLSRFLPPPPDELASGEHVETFRALLRDMTLHPRTHAAYEAAIAALEFIVQSREGSAFCRLTEQQPPSVDLRVLARDIHYAITDDGLAPLSPTGNAAMREAIQRVLTARLADTGGARPAREWHEDYGPVVWWKFPVNEPAWIGTPLDSDWPGYHTHWTPHPEIPTAPQQPTGEESHDAR